MIPKIIHYCWFGGNPLPESAKKCIASWRKFLPDYEIKEWNESNFDVNSIAYTREAYKLKKYAYVSDYARLWILYNYGGLYFDTDVELIKSIDDIISRGNFMGREPQRDDKDHWTDSKDFSNDPNFGLGVNPGLGLGVKSRLGLFKEIINWYKDKHYVSKLGKTSSSTIVNIVSDIIVGKPFKRFEDGVIYTCGVYIYPSDYFCPKNYATGKLTITANTRSIHHFASTWVKHESVCQKIVRRLRGMKAYYL